MSDAARAEAERRWPRDSEPQAYGMFARVAFTEGVKWQASRPVTDTEYWKREHDRLVNAIEELSTGNTDHPDGLVGALQALHYSATGGRKPSPEEMREFREWLAAREARNA